MRRRTDGGFTIIELMVVIVIVGVMAAVALPSFSRDIRANAVKREARVATEVFHEARGEASTSARAMFVLFQGTAQSPTHLRVLKAGTSSACTLPTGIALPPNTSSWWLTNTIYREASNANGTVAVVPAKAGEAVGTATMTRCACIRPNGMLYVVPCTGGPPEAFGTRLELYVDDVRKARASDYVVEVGVNGLAKVYRP